MPLAEFCGIILHFCRGTFISYISYSWIKLYAMECWFLENKRFTGPKTTKELENEDLYGLQLQYSVLFLQRVNNRQLQVTNIT